MNAFFIIKENETMFALFGYTNFLGMLKCSSRAQRFFKNE